MAGLLPTIPGNGASRGSFRDGDGGMRPCRSSTRSRGDCISAYQTPSGREERTTDREPAGRARAVLARPAGCCAVALACAAGSSWVLPAPDAPGKGVGGGILVTPNFLA